MPRTESPDMRDRFFGSHEALARDEAVKPSSDRNFGLVLAGFFGLLAAFSIWHGTARWPFWGGAALVLLVFALVMPRALAPFNRLWTRLGLLLHGIVAPVMLALIFYLCITPVGFLMRLFGTDP